MIITPLTANAFCKSIEIALDHPPDVNKSLTQIQKSLNRLPDKRLLVSTHKGKISFLTVADGKRKYISKKSSILYSLARRRHQKTLSEILKLSDSNRKKDHIRRDKLITDLKQFITTCELGNLDIARIVLTGNQYKWFTSRFIQKPIDEAKAYKTARGLPVRSKSERDIINKYDDYAVPLHYEEQQTIYVKPLVDHLYDDLISEGYFRKGSAVGRLYNFNGSSVFWNVPTDLEWMNAPGSIWKTYYPPRGTLKIHIDIKTMLADSSFLFHEHEGMMDDFHYRCHSSERSSILKYTGIVRPENFLETYEHTIDTTEKIIRLIEERIIPRLWF